MKQFFVVLLAFGVLLGANTTISGGNIEENSLVNKEQQLANMQSDFSGVMSAAKKNLLVVSEVRLLSKIETPGS